MGRYIINIKIYSLLAISSLILLVGCKETSEHSEKKSAGVTLTRSADPGFNAEASDAKAIAIADSVMQAMGGKESWKQTEIISWNFFGNRTHTWNKMTGRDYIQIPEKNLVIDMNINSKEGTVIKNGKEVTQPDSLQKYLQQGYEMWVNDSYWLFMPFKLKDGGVTLNYMGIDSTQAGKPSYKLKLTFDQVGVTPKNKFHVYVDTSDYLVRQWAYFPKANMENPEFILPWKDYEKYGEILLSGNRGKFTLSNIKVMEEWPDSLK